MESKIQTKPKDGYLGKRTTPAAAAPKPLTNAERQAKLFNESNFVALMQTSEELYKFLTRVNPKDKDETVGKCTFENDKVGCNV